MKMYTLSFIFDSSFNLILMESDKFPGTFNGVGSSIEETDDRPTEVIAADHIFTKAGVKFSNETLPEEHFATLMSDNGEFVVYCYRFMVDQLGVQEDRDVNLIQVHYYELGAYADELSPYVLSLMNLAIDVPGGKGVTLIV